MSINFRNGLEVLLEHELTPKLTTGILELDGLLAGGLELGTFSVLYGDNEPLVNRILHILLCNCLLPQQRYGFNGKTVLLNCGDHSQEQALLDLKLATNLLKSNGLDPAKALDRIIAVSAFNMDQASRSIEETVNALKTDSSVKLVAARNLPKLFIEIGVRDKASLERTQQLQHLIAKLWQTCSERNVSLIISCRPRRLNSLRPSPPEGGVFLRHLAQVMVCFRKKEQSGSVLAYLLKHPKRQPRVAEFTLNQADLVTGRLTAPFRGQLQEAENLSRDFEESPMDSTRRDV